MWLQLLTPQGGSPPTRVISLLLSQPNPFSSFPTQFHMVPSLNPWSYLCLSASLQLVFGENFSKCRCIFDVSVGGVFLLLYHLNTLSL